MNPQEWEQAKQRIDGTIKKGLALGLPPAKTRNPNERDYEDAWLKYFCVSRHEVNFSSGPTMYQVRTPAGRSGTAPTLLEALIKTAESTPR
jgi:hypothetical protein